MSPTARAATAAKTRTRPRAECRSCVPTAQPACPSADSGTRSRSQASLSRCSRTGSTVTCCRRTAFASRLNRFDQSARNGGIVSSARSRSDVCATTRSRRARDLQPRPRPRRRSVARGAAVERSGRSAAPSTRKEHSLSAPGGLKVHVDLPTGLPWAAPPAAGGGPSDPRSQAACSLAAIHRP
jgi:hypothetical protein